MERGGRWDILILPFFIYGQINIFTAHIFNAIFLEAYGIDGSAVITQSEETSSTLNDQSVWAYAAVMKTAEGQDVVTGFDTMSASIYPITNAILIPPQGERFVVRYIPGFPRNFVIMRDLSPYGKKYRLGEDRRPVEKAAAQFAASLDNRAFVAEYRNAFEIGRRLQTDAAIFHFLSDDRRSERINVEGESIVALDRHDLPEVGDQAVRIGLPMPEKIRIPRHPIVVRYPYRGQHAAFQDEAVAMRRKRQAVEQSFERKPHQQDIERTAFLAGDIKKPVLDRFRHVGRCFTH